MPFYERVGTATRELVAASNGVLSGTATWATDKYGWAFSNDGTTGVDTITTQASQNSLTQMSLEFLIRPKSQGGGSLGRICHKTTGTTNHFQSYTGGTNALVFGQGFATGSDDWQTPNSSLPLAAYTHCVVAMNMNGVIGTAPTMYLNGVKQTVTNLFVGVGTAVADTSNLYIGNRSDGIRGFDGQILYLRQWRRQLSASEAQQLYRNPFIVYRKAPPAPFANIASVIANAVGSTWLMMGV